MRSYTISNGDWDDFLCADEPDCIDYDILFGPRNLQPPTYRSKDSVGVCL
jgi:hypothetical protein